MRCECGWRRDADGVQCLFPDRDRFYTALSELAGGSHLSCAIGGDVRPAGGAGRKDDARPVWRTLPGLREANRAIVAALAEA